jgi:hypothetical protein
MDELVAAATREASSRWYFVIAVGCLSQDGDALPNFV